MRIFGARGTRILFVHIPKTGGLALYGALRRWAGPERSFRYARGDKADFQHFRSRPQSELDGLRVLSGHLPWPVFRERCDVGWLPVTVVREPIERALSAYSYILGWEGHPLHEKVKDWSLRQFIEWQVGRRGPNPQCLFLSGSRTAAETRALLEERGFFAVSTSDIPRLAGALSKEVGSRLEPGQENVTGKRLRRSDLDDETLGYLGSVFDEDASLVASVGASPLLPERPSWTARLPSILRH